MRPWLSHRRASGFRCTECGWQSAKWTGRCGECQAWGTVQEAVLPRLARAARAGAPGGIRSAVHSAAPASTTPIPIGQVDATDATARPTGMDELDRVLGGGLVPGAVLLLAGEPGVGKSTLLLETGALVAETGPVLYVTGEESAAQVRLRADRIGAVSDQLFLAAETDLDVVLGHIEHVQPRLLIIDSVQTIAAAGVEGVPGGVTQVREVAAALTAVAKERSLTTILVGHVTKDGSVAGPRTLEHLVDVVLHFDGDRHSQLRMVRAVKNRFGPTDEVGCFDLGEYGLIGLPDPSGLFLSQHREPVPGTCVTVTLEGRRPLPAEVQALVGLSALEMPRRATSGLDGSRVGMVLAVLQRRAGIKLGKQDVYAATVGGVRLTEPSVDLAVAVALASSAANLSVPHGVVAIGEVGLAGEVRRVAGPAAADRRGRADGLPPRHRPGGLRSAPGARRRPLPPDAGAGGGRHPPGALRRPGRRAVMTAYGPCHDRQHHVDVLRRAGAGLVCAERAGPALARARRDAVGGAGQRDHAAADAGGPSAARVPELDGQVAHPGGARRPRRPARQSGSGAGSAIRAARSGCTRRRRFSWPGTAGRCPPTWTPCARCRGSGATPRRPWPASPSASGTPCSTPTCGGCWPGWSPGSRVPAAASSAVSVAERRLAESLLPAESAVAARWSVAVMELGALVCTAASPRCDGCPVAGDCAWLAAGRPAPPDGAARQADAEVRRAPTGSAGAGCWRCCARPAARCAGPTSTSPGPTRAQLDRALDGLVADGLVDPLADGRFALPGAERGLTA